MKASFLISGVITLALFLAAAWGSAFAIIS